MLLTRIDPDRRMKRFYLLGLDRSLFGEWCLWREWGRIGQAGQLRIDRYAREDQARAALEDHARRKRRRGYGARVPDGRG